MPIEINLLRAEDERVLEHVGPDVFDHASLGGIEAPQTTVMFSFALDDRAV